MKLRWRKVCGALGVFLSLNFVAAKWAQAEIAGSLEARGLELGRQLYQAASLMDAFEGEPARGRAGGAHQLLLNGAEVVLHSGSVKLSEQTNLTTLVAKVNANCRSYRGGAEERASEEPLIQAPHFEWVGENEAFVYCLKATRPLSLEAISQHLDAFGKTGDLSLWGTFQGAYFRLEESSISILTAEIKRDFVPAKMFPPGSDAPGENIASLPAPSGRRMLSLGHNGKTALTMYEEKRAPLQTLNEYNERLIEAGLSVERAAVGEANSEESRSFALVARSETESFVIAARGADDLSHLVIARLPD